MAYCKASSTQGGGMTITRNRSYVTTHAVGNNPNGELFCPREQRPGTVPGGYPEYPEDPARGGSLTENNRVRPDPVLTTAELPFSFYPKCTGQT